MRQIFLDTETTGLEVAEGHRVIEIGCVELVNRQPTGHDLHLYLNPERDIDAGAQAVHGITAEFLADKPVFADVAQQFLDFIQGADEVIIHNATFDVGFLNNELALLGRPPFKTHVEGIIDTLAMAKELYPGKRNSLDALCDRLEVDNSGRTLHGALLDAELLADVYINLTRGQNALLMVEDDAQNNEAGHIEGIDLCNIPLQVLAATDAEQAAHAAILAQIDKASNGKTVWRLAVSA